MLALPHGSELDSLAGHAKDMVQNIRSAMNSGTLSAASLASLTAGLNLGVDVGALVTESAGAGRATAASVQLAAASVESRATVERLSDEMYRKHLFDADLERHTHGAELEAFRKRQAEDEKYIREQLGRHTSEGDLNASGRMEGSMLDANAHGAGDNPAFMSKWNELKAKTDKLRASMQAAGQSTEEYDKHIRQDVADFLRAKGLSDSQIEQALAKNENPLDAVKPYLASDKDSQQFTQSLGHANDDTASSKRTVLAIPDDGQPQAIDMNAMDARLAAAGLGGGATGGGETGHGLNVQKPRTSVIEH